MRKEIKLRSTIFIIIFYHLAAVGIRVYDFLNSSNLLTNFFLLNLSASAIMSLTQVNWIDAGPFNVLKKWNSAV